MAAEMQRIVLSKAAVDSVDLAPLERYVCWRDDDHVFCEEAGREHYRLLAYLGREMRCRELLDVGTCHGFSAVALSSDPAKLVRSFDVVDRIPCSRVTARDRPNVVLRVGDGYMAELADITRDTDLVLIDIDHTGAAERELMAGLRAAGYRGLVLLDDIKLNDEMRRFWDEIPEAKLDVSAVGHWSGTGLVVFDPSRFEVQLEP